MESGGRVFKGLSVIIEREGRATRSTALSTASVKPFYARPSNIWHPKEDEFVQVWGAEILGLENTRSHTRQCIPCWTRGGWSAQRVPRDGSTGRELGVPRPASGRHGVGLGLGDKGTGQLTSL